MYIYENLLTHKVSGKGPVRPLICTVLMVSAMGTTMRFYGTLDKRVLLKFMEREHTK